MTRIYQAKVCCRIDLAGGWSDVPEFADVHTGQVVSVGINRFMYASAKWDQAGFDLQTQMDLPSNTHLGTSASADLAFLAVTLALVGRLSTDEAGRTELAERSFQLEGLVGEKGGKQDHYAAAFGGLRHYHFGHRDQPATAQQISHDERLLADLADHLLLWHTDVDSKSGDIHSDVWKRYRAGDEQLVQLVKNLRDSATPMHAALQDADWPRVGGLLTENRRLAAGIDSRVEPPALTKFFAAVDSAGGWGAKACGVGGGGCIVIATARERRDTMRAALRELGGKEITYRVAETQLPEI